MDFISRFGRDVYKRQIRLLSEDSIGLFYLFFYEIINGDQSVTSL